MRHAHTTKQDVIEREIVPALTVPGISDPAEYDLDAIFDECWTYDANAGGFLPVDWIGDENADDEFPTRFWLAVQKHLLWEGMTAEVRFDISDITALQVVVYDAEDDEIDAFSMATTAHALPAEPGAEFAFDPERFLEDVRTGLWECGYRLCQTLGGADVEDVTEVLTVKVTLA